MTINDLKGIIAPTSYVTVWAMSDKGKFGCAYMGACKRLPEGFGNIEVRVLEACDNDLELTVRAEDLMTESERKARIDAEIDGMLGWMNIRR